MLTRLRLTNFKSFVDEEIELAPLTLLVGANASGKSNFLDAIWFLHGLAQNLPLDEVLNGETRPGGRVWSGLRGNAAEVAFVGSQSFAVESLWNLETRSEPVQHRIRCEIRPTPLPVAESLIEQPFSVEAVATDGDKTHVKVNGTTKVRQRLKGTVLDVLAEDGFFYNVHDIRFPFNDLPDILLDAWRRIQWPALSPAAMREFGRRGPDLGEDGRNFSGFLAQVCDDPEAKATLVSWLAELCAPELVDIDFIEVHKVDQVLAELVEQGNRRITARAISDGTLRFLGTLLALRTAEPNSLFLLEEIEAGLHPARIQLLVGLLEALTRDRKVQIIATTHSPVVLEWLRAEALRDTVVFGRVPEHEGTIARRLRDIPHFEDVVARTGIAEMFSTGWLEMAL